MRTYRKLIKRLGHHPLFAAFARRFGWRVDRALYRWTKGRLSPTGTVAPVLLLTSTGRKTGQQRTTPVIFVRDGDRFIVSSEDVGMAKRAAWPLNLDANPDVRVQVGGDVLPCRARRLDDAEIERYWPRLVELWPPHETYRERSGRRHTFALEPSAR